MRACHDDSESTVHQELWYKLFQDNVAAQLLKKLSTLVRQWLRASDFMIFHQRTVYTYQMMEEMQRA